MNSVIQLLDLDEQIVSIIRQSGYTTTMEIIGVLEAIKFDILNEQSMEE